MSRTLQLRTRLAIAGLLLIATTVATGVWSVTAFRRVSRVVGETVTENERVTDATTTLANLLEREDDALVLALNDPARGAADLAHLRGEVGTALDRVRRLLAVLAEHELAVRLGVDVERYHATADTLVPNARTRYHELVNPLLRRAVGSANEVRDRHLRSSQQIAEWAAGQATRSMAIVAAISLAALVLLVLVVLHFARVVMRPIGELARVVHAIRRGDFSQRVAAPRDDELGRLGVGLDQMADELEEARRTNIREVIVAKETLEATLEAFPDAVLVIGDDGTVTAANPSARAALGTAREAIDAVIARGAAPDATVDLARTIELPLGGRPRRLLPRVVPIASRRGAVLVLSDVTELARLDEMRLELVAVASHELRTPLTTMRMTLSMLQERAAAYQLPDRELVGTAMLGVEQLSRLVDEFLDLTRIEAGELRLQWTRVAPAVLVDKAAASLAPACDQVGVALEVVHGDGLPGSIAGDQARLAMVVTNLLANALAHTPAGGRIRLSTAAAGDRLALEVDDTGPGVPPELRERVFERFFRVEHGRARELASAGAGIGLYLARQVIEAHGGTIRCETSPLGGARFAIALPREAPQINTPVSTSLTTMK